MTLFNDERVHFVGVGGVGMSAIAKVLLERGVPVSGSDLKRSRALTMLEAMGARVHVGHDASLVDGAGAVVVSSAIPAANPEVARAHRTGLRVMTRGEALAAVLEGRKTIVVGGTHGKTTTTSMIVSILRAAGFDPTYLVGGGLNDSGTNARSGRDDIAVAEADESDGSFLLLRPQVAVVTNVDLDHVDYWNDLRALQQAFAAWMHGVAPGGKIVVPAGDAFLVESARSAGRAVMTFGRSGDVRASNVELDRFGARFRLWFGDDAASVALRVPGRHNVDNALAAAAGCLYAGLRLPDVGRGLGEYRGVERRFQVRGRSHGVTVIDDYAHNPAKVRAALAAVRSGGWRRVVAVFQPHRYTRTVALADGFGPAFADADRVVVTEVYGAGEIPVPGVSGKVVADAVCARLPGRPVAYLPHRDELLSYLLATARPGDALVTLGAGDITSLGEEFLRDRGARA